MLLCVPMQDMTAAVVGSQAASRRATSRAGTLAALWAANGAPSGNVAAVRLSSYPAASDVRVAFSSLMRNS